MSRFPELRRRELEQFLEQFSKHGALKYRNNKWLGLTREGKPYTVHVKHGTTTKYAPSLVEAVARDLGVGLDEFMEWYQEQ